MIVTNQAHVLDYLGINTNLDKALSFIAETDISSLDDGSYPIDGEDVRVKVQHMRTKNSQEARLEAHEAYADIQMLLEGTERIGWRYPLFAGGFVGGIIFPLLIWLEPYRMRRVFAFLDPWEDPLNRGFQAIQGLIAFANGGAWGAGLGHGFQKLNYLPAAYTDFIFAAIGEELGFVGTACVLALFGFWMLQARATYFRTRDDFKASLTWGISLTILLPLVINVAGVTKMIPLTGMALPFISYGGTSLVTMWARVGLILRLEKDSYLEDEDDDRRIAA